MALYATPPSRHQGGTSTFGVVFLIVNAALGAGLLNFPQVEGGDLQDRLLNIPQAFDQAGGVLVAVLVQVRIPGKGWEYLEILKNTRKYLGKPGNT